jgi:hypothetical protein
MLIFTPKQIEELLSIVDKHHTMFIATNIGTRYLSMKEKQILKDAGIDLSKWDSRRGKIDEAFAFGILSAAISDSRVKGMKYKDFKKFMQSKNYMPLTTLEQAAVDHLKYQSFADITNLKGRIKNDLSVIMLNEDKNYRTKFEEATRESAIKTVEMRGSVKDMISELGHKTQDWERDLGRIAEYTLHTAYEEGRAAQLEKEYGTKDVLVYKDVYPGACKHCIKHYLTGGLGSQPKIFKLSELKANGTNIGKKVDDWQATLGPLHPYCRCTINDLPEGYEWDKDSSKFVRGRYKAKHQKVKDRKKVAIKIGDENYLV